MLVEKIIEKNIKTSSAYGADENKIHEDEKNNLTDVNELYDEKDKKTKVRGRPMSIFNKFLYLSNSFKFYKSNYDVLKKKNIKLANENKKLKAKNKKLNSNLEKLGRYYQEKYQKQLADNQLTAESLENESDKE